MEIKTRNVNTAFSTLVGLFQTRERGGDVVPWETHGRPAPIVGKSPRGMPTLMVDEPVTILYERPLERVLLSAARDANPFFHLYHSLWLLAGRDDVAAPAHYARRYAEFSDDGVTSNGSYGRRWRHADRKSAYRCEDSGPGEIVYHDTDQIARLVTHLKDKPESRRAVLQMWSVEDDLLKVDTSKDVCCNLSVLLSVRDAQPEDACTFVACPKYLDVTVFNRSNDLVWGTLGEDYCTFSFLQEYVAARLGVEVGRYWQVSNNLHVYLSNFKPDEWLVDPLTSDVDPYSAGTLRTVPLVRDPVAFDEELPQFVKLHSSAESGLRRWDGGEPFLRDVADPTLKAFHARKLDRDAPTQTWTDRIEADDWRLAAREWFERRRR